MRSRTVQRKAAVSRAAEFMVGFVIGFVGAGLVPFQRAEPKPVTPARWRPVG